MKKKERDEAKKAEEEAKKKKLEEEHNDWSAPEGDDYGNWEDGAWDDEFDWDV